MKREQPKRWQVMALAQRLWEQHGHPGETCEPGSKGLGSCALDEVRRTRQNAEVPDRPMTPAEADAIAEGIVKPVCTACGGRVRFTDEGWVHAESGNAREPVYVAGGGWKGGPVGYRDKGGTVHPERGTPAAATPPLKETTMTDNRPDNDTVDDVLDVKPEVQRAPQTAPGTELADMQDDVAEKLGAENGKH